METTKWVLDTTHSEIQFKIKHLMISTVTGQFNKFEGTVETDGNDFATAKAFFSADIDSISTNNEQRDGHLKNSDFFDAENHPKLTFESTSVTKINDEEYELHGLLTMRGVSKPVTLHAELGGIVEKDPWGHTRVGFSLTGKIKRKDFGVSFGLLSETGGVALSDEVKLVINSQFVKLAEAVAA